MKKWGPWYVHVRRLHNKETCNGQGVSSFWKRKMKTNQSDKAVMEVWKGITKMG